MSITGLEGIISGLAGIARGVEGEVQGEMETTLQSAFDKSQDAVPVLSGTLRDSGHVDIGHLQGSITYDADYALFVHEGHLSRAGNPVPPNPFLVPFVEEETEALFELLKIWARS